MTEMFKLHGLSTTLTCIALLTFVCIALAFDAHRIDGINPKCEAVSAPLCRTITDDISVRNGRNRRSLSERSINSNHNQESTARDSVRNKRRARIPPASSTFEWRYNSTTFPNFANDRTPDDVTESLRHLHPMIATECSKFAKLFLCSVHSPVCTEFGVVPPCRELCEKVLSDCARTIEAFGIEWPDSVRCSLFPPENPTDDVSNEAAFGERAMYKVEDSGTLIQRAVPLTWMEALVADGKICIPPSDDDAISPKLELLAKNIHHRPMTSNNSAEHSKANHQYGLWCPAEMRSPPGQLGYSFLGMENCSPPCPNMYLSEGELAGIRYVIIVMSTLCIIVTLFTLCTFLIDRSRFRYPERPIVFYAFSYFMVSMTFTIGFILKEDAACNEEVREVETHDIIQGFTVVKGDHKQSCTILFMILYYFTVNGTIWWLILTVTWLLAAGFKWGSEAIEKYSMYYHSIAWGIPAVQTMLVVTFSKIEGDNIAGVCFLGLYDSEGLRYMLLAPLCVYLFVGISILCAGFCCLNRVRIKLRNDEVNKKILAKFMLRIGVFSVLYIVPQVFLLVVYVIEDSHRTQWEASWFLKACDEYRVPCPAVGSNVIVTAGDGDDRPHVMLFCFKYVMTLIVALPPLFWVASKKTLLSWQIFSNRNNGWRSHVVTGNNNSNYFRPTTSSRKALLRDESITVPANDKSLSLGDGGVERDDVFTGFEGNNLLRGSSASVAALERAAVETDSRESAVLEHQIPDPNPPFPPPPLPQSGEAQVKIKTVFKKEFPEKRWDNLAASSASTSSRMTSSMLRHSSSTSSLRSDKRRLRRTNQRTSTLNRVEYEEKLTRDLGRGSPFVSADVPPQKSDVGLPTKKQTPPVPPPKPRRITLPMTSRGSASSHSNVDSVQREIHVAKSATVKVLPAATTGDTVEV